MTGKLTAKHWTIGATSDDIFSINLYVFKIRASGDEVSFGFVIFVLSLAGVIWFGGEDLYLLFKARSGLNIGHWNSMCVVASFISVLVAVLIYLYFLWSTRGPPIIPPTHRAEQIEQLERKLGEQESLNG
jgi:hypothetical protein